MAAVWTMSALEVINDAYSLIGVKGPRGSLDANLFALGVRTLNGVLKELSLHGFTPAQLSAVDASLSWSAGSPGEVAAPADLWGDLLLSRADASGHRIGLHSLSRAAWLAILGRSAAGVPTHFHVDGSRVLLWPVPSVDPVLSASYVSVPDDAVSAGVPDVPQSGLLALVWGVAAHLAPHFQVDATQYMAGWVAKRNDLISGSASTAPVIFELVD